MRGHRAHFITAREFWIHFFCRAYYKRMPHGVIQQINISKGGIPKRPIGEAVVTELGIEGDVHAHPQYHGGPRKALLLISEEGIAELTQAGFPLYAGALGENITTKGLD